MADTPFFLGLISGTSADAIDVALCRFTPTPECVATAAFPYPPDLRRRVLALARDAVHVNLDELGQLDVEIGRVFADAALAALSDAGVPAAAIRAIGSHGQTIRHRPGGTAPFTLQIGDPNTIAERTGITTVADFRRRDVAAGGQGAPLVPIFHAAVLRHPTHDRAVLNLGGIANVTLLPSGPSTDVRGFDTGPANCLLDAWAERHQGTHRDDGGRWAAQGMVDQGLLADLLADPYFALAGPKSSGREVFNLDWLDRALGGQQRQPVDVQATLLALTVRSVADAIRRDAPGTREVLVCGGGVHNGALMRALTESLAPANVESTAACGVDPDFLEAMAFAWLARQRLERQPGSRTSVTGAIGDRVLGAVYDGG
ncbi:anhydro-N-acetylmuramic acid kinase [Tahibacter amnicola]|uniref:Anhydro-N-acetylmuramic acid kinase n=1 Tax=Tahibacter amnicola TaxID=2976241 RepID=A0ABY6BGN5_9GAMM|nr:anhydro-N-acetylmuramic acid kinase [Tahibacter amnicola]UXI68240.1 anhydro-N-acetylmuramic acid kinase [Tahibacter amnicola]